jgi:hypothetical protein
MNIFADGNELGNELHQARLVHISGTTSPAPRTWNRAMAHIPYASEYSPERWQKGINVMLEKKKGNFRVDKLRAILLYEANFNRNNKKLGRDVMYTAEQ